MTVVYLEDRRVLHVGGADAVPFLQGLLTQDVALLAPDRPLYAGLLSPQGKALFPMLLFAGCDGVLIDVDAGQAEALAKRLAIYRLRRAVTIAPSPLVVVAGWDGHETGQTPDPRSAALGGRWLAEPRCAAGADVWHAHRRAVGVPDAAEIGQDDLLWLEAGGELLNGVSYTKGCYVGQENTARMHHRDRVRRLLLPIACAAADTGDGEVRDAEGRSVGRLRSVLVDGRGFAHLRLEALASPLAVNDVPLTALRPAWAEPVLHGPVAA